MQSIHLPSLLLKTLIIFVLINLAFFAWYPLDSIGKVSAYNTIIPGRERFPFGENSSRSYNLSLYNVNAMFASHEVLSAPPDENEYRVFLIGDSSVWGTLLHPEETLAGQLNQLELTCANKNVKVFNLGYPTISVTKDLMVIEQAKAYQPDRIIWLTTLEALPYSRQLDSPIAANNPGRIQALNKKYGLQIMGEVGESPANATWWESSIPGQRRALADLFRLQAYGVLWAATGIDQEYPEDYAQAQRDFENAELEYQGWQPPGLPVEQLAFDVLQAGFESAGEIPVLLVNEPMLITTGAGAKERYNFFYPRWAYDQYREHISAKAVQQGWEFVDAWNLVPETEFTNSAIHLTPTGEAILADFISESICAD